MVNCWCYFCVANSQTIEYKTFKPRYFYFVSEHMVDKIVIPFKTL